MGYSDKEIKELLIKRSRLDSQDEILKIEEMIIENYIDDIKTLSNRYKTKNLGIEDLMQEGYLSILRSIRNFDPNKKAKFSEFMLKKLESDIILAIEDEEKEVTRGEYISSSLNKILDSEEKLIERLKRYPTLEELSSYSEISIDEIKELKEYALEILSLDKTDENKNKLLSELIKMSSPDSNTEDASKDDIELINASIARLSDSEKDIITMYYGLNGINKKTIQEIADIYDVTTERIRQIVSRIERKLKNDMEDY